MAYKQCGWLQWDQREPNCKEFSSMVQLTPADKRAGWVERAVYFEEGG